MKKKYKIGILVCVLMLSCSPLAVQAQTVTGDLNDSSKVTAVDGLLALKRGYSENVVQKIVAVASESESTWNDDELLAYSKCEAIYLLKQYRTDEIAAETSETFKSNISAAYTNASVTINDSTTEEEVSAALETAKSNIDSIIEQSGNSGWSPIV
ncbi:MAG: hypothetical protein ACI4CT_08705 [Lachnospiraceae bacterium]